jgi:Flp pilus assembly protein CpaB
VYLRDLEYDAPMVAVLALACMGSDEGDRVTVVVAARDLSVGVPIAEGDVYGLPMELRYVPEHAFGAMTDVIGRVPSSRILANEPVDARRLADAELQRQLEALVPRGLEVVTVPLDPAAARAPIPRRDRVDVVSAAGPVASGLPVLRVDGDQVAVMADPAQVRAIAGARAAGTISVTVP